MCGPWTKIGSLLVLALSVWGPSVAKAGHEYRIGVGEAGSFTYRVGVGVSSLVKVVLLPKTEIDLTVVEKADPAERILLLQAGQAQLALLPAGYDARTSLGRDFRSVMVFQNNAADSDLDREVQLVVHRELEDEVVYQVTKVIAENEEFLGTVQPGLVNLSPAEAKSPLLPWHGGAQRYYQETTAGQPEQGRGPIGDLKNSPILGSAIFFVYFESDDKKLNELALLQINAACDYARQQDLRSIVVTGYADKTRPQSDNRDLARTRTETVASAILADDRCTNEVAIRDPGASSLPSSRHSDIAISDQRRVEIEVVPGGVESASGVLRAKQQKPRASDN